MPILILMICLWMEQGELLIIKAPNLDLGVVIKSSVFILQLEMICIKSGLLMIGRQNEYPTEEGKQELIEKLSELISCDFEVVKHFAGCSSYS